MKRIALAVVLATLASCTPPEPQAPTRPPTRYVPPPPMISQSQRPRPRVDNSDQCGARPMQQLVGKPRSEIPVPVDPSRRRVACTTCPVTQDFRPDRLNFFYDADTGLIREVKCG